MQKFLCGGLVVEFRFFNEFRWGGFASVLMFVRSRGECLGYDYFSVSLAKVFQRVLGEGKRSLAKNALWDLHVLPTNIK